MKRKYLLYLPLIIIVAFLFSCESDEAKLARIEKECAARDKIQGLAINFMGYFPKDADSVQIMIKRGKETIKNYTDTIPKRIIDSSQHLRNYVIMDELNVKDTLLIKIKNEPVKKISNFHFIVKSHYTMMGKNWGCELRGFRMNGIENEGYSIQIMKKEFNILDREKFKSYYK